MLLLIVSIQSKSIRVGLVNYFVNINAMLRWRSSSRLVPTVNSLLALDFEINYI